MPSYEMQCKTCGRKFHEYRTFDTFDTLPTHCSCGGTFRRLDYRSIGFGRMMHHHFNHSIGKPISDRKQFSDELKRKSEEMSERLGMEHRYSEIDITERKAVGVPDGWEYGDHRQGA